MESEMNEITNKRNRRLGIIKNLGFSLKLPGFPIKAIKGVTGDSAYKISEDYRVHMNEIEYRKARVLAEAQRLQSNR
jgi:hypothetical protein